eukprot:2436227-Amphidinium_carterae.1
MPAGGSSYHYTALLSWYPALPGGLASESDSAKILATWKSSIRATYQAAAGGQAQFRFPLRLEEMPGRSVDVCADSSFVHASESMLNQAMNTIVQGAYTLP